MAAFEQMDRTELQSELDRLKEEYAQFKAKGLSLMARWQTERRAARFEPALLSRISSAQDCIAEDGTDCRNYGVLDGLPEAKRLMATMLDDTPKKCDRRRKLEPDAHGQCRRAMLLDFGTLGSKPWAQYPGIK